MLQDIYSTGWMLEVQTEEHTMRQVVDQSIRPQSVREILETTTLVRNAIDGWLSLGEIRQSREGDQMILSAEVLITALYLDDGEELQSIQRTVQTDCRLDCPVQAVCQCWCTAPGELAVVPAAADWRCASLWNSTASVWRSAGRPPSPPRVWGGTGQAGRDTALGGAAYGRSGRAAVGHCESVRYYHRGDHPSQ